MLLSFWQLLGLGQISKRFNSSILDVVTPGEVALYLFKRTFPVWQALGFYVIPKHFYEPIPDTTKLKESLWQRHSELAGIDLREEQQLALLAELSATYRAEYEQLPQEKTAVPHQYYVGNHRFSSVDGEMLYCMIRHVKPKTMFEIGSGFSTYLAAQALRTNAQVDQAPGDLVTCDPYANPTIRAGIPGLSRLVLQDIQDVPLSEITRLQENDILFIDSSHVLKIGSDVQYEYLDILPRLNKGVLVHVHDIFLPAEYPRSWVKGYYRFWTEQYLLQAFLAFNDSFEVLWAGSFMHIRHPAELERAFRSYRRGQTWPGSFWMRKTR